jgi:tRNA(Ser,Leu) C12 N-acetylase TAN1
MPASIDFQDPDAILAVETVGQRGGLSLWTREQLRTYPFLGLD